ncbi:MAG: peptidoglycan-binding protein [Rhodospirillales bacterium]|nr:peptidoglycan-binding protein [Rhodospirillales bacterium]
MAVMKRVRQFCRLGLVLSLTMLAACATGTGPETESASAALVARVQALLAEIDYRPGVVDGIEGPLTGEAVRAYQTAAGLEVDGRVSESLVARLERDKQMRLVVEVQGHLAALGYELGPADGKVGARTRRAVEAFQEAQGLPQDGRVTARLRDQLAAARDAPEGRISDTQPGPPMEASAGTGDKSAEIAATDPQNLILGPGDRVLLSYSGTETAPAEVEIGPDGRVALPEAGSVQAAGLDLKQLRDQVTVRLIESYLGKLDVRVILIEAHGEPGADAGETPDSKTHVLAPGDRLSVSLAAEAANPADLEVGPDGSLALPETGRVPAAGLGLAELRDSITVKLLETYMGNLRVKVDLADAGDSLTSAE